MPSSVLNLSLKNPCIFLHIAALLLEDLIGYEEIQQPILMGLVGMLKASDDGLSTTATAGVNLGQWLLGVSFHYTHSDVITCYHSNSTQCLLHATPPVEISTTFANGFEMPLYTYTEAPEVAQSQSSSHSDCC